MASSPSHRFGQIIGEVLERAIEPRLEAFARANGLFLDKHGRRPARKGLKVSWTDGKGNVHDLDFVLERGGSAQKRGTPAAFIESAWRRYTKHSRNKAQEIQGAIKPLAEQYRENAPFIGVIVAGDFTHGALDQMKSQGFHLIHFPYEGVLNAFSAAGIDAAFDEDTPDSAFARKVSAWNRLSSAKQIAVAKRLMATEAEQVRAFEAALSQSVSRRVASVRILPLHGLSRECASLEEAISVVRKYRGGAADAPLAMFEVEVRFSNGDRIDGHFSRADDAVSFLLRIEGQ